MSETREIAVKKHKSPLKVRTGILRSLFAWFCMQHAVVLPLLYFNTANVVNTHSDKIRRKSTIETFCSKFQPHLLLSVHEDSSLYSRLSTHLRQPTLSFRPAAPAQFRIPSASAASAIASAVA